MTSLRPFNQLPAAADSTKIKPYDIAISTEKVERMKQLIELSNIPAACYENSLPDGNRKLGVQRDWLTAMRDRWLNNFDWKQTEARINSLPNFMANIADEKSSPGNPYDIHFIALFSARPDAVPLLFLHGWPGSVLEFVPMLELVKSQYPDSATLPYHIVVPSLPGFGFSSAPPVDQSRETFGMESDARIFDTLIASIFGASTKYIAQGGDIGSRIARILAAKYPNCVATHLNFCNIPEPLREKDEPALPVEEIEKKGLERAELFEREGRAYAIEQATRPSTLGLVLSSNPLATLCWVGEKFLDWTDPASFPAEPPHSSPDSAFANEILASASLYWLTEHVTTSFYTYKEAYATNPKSHASPEYHIHAPKFLGHSWFPKELIPVPISWLNTTGNMIWWKRHEVGGHFAAFEQPEALWADVVEFVDLVKQKSA